MIKPLNVEYALEAAFIKGLRAVFQYDKEFPFVPDNKLTAVAITTTYPEKEAEFKIPQILVAGIGYQFSPIGLFSNFHSDIIKEGAVVGKRYAAPVPYSAQMVCLASRDGVSKDLASKVADYLSFTAREVFSDILRLNINEVAKSPGGPQRTVPATAFANTVRVSGVLHWVGSKTPLNRQTIQRIRVEMSTE